MLRAGIAGKFGRETTTTTHDPALFGLHHRYQAIKQARRAFQDSVFVAFHLRTGIRVSGHPPGRADELTWRGSQFKHPSLRNSEGVWTSEHSKHARSFLVVDFAAIDIAILVVGSWEEFCQPKLLLPKCLDCSRSSAKRSVKNARYAYS